MKGAILAVSGQRSRLLTCLSHSDQRRHGSETGNNDRRRPCIGDRLAWADPPGTSQGSVRGGGELAARKSALALPALRRRIPRGSGRAGAAAHQQHARDARRDLVFFAAEDARVLPGHRDASRARTHRTRPAGQEDVQHLGHADAVEDVDAEMRRPPLVQRAAPADSGKSTVFRRPRGTPGNPAAWLTAFSSRMT